MKKILLLCSLFFIFFACKKSDKRESSSYGQACDAMHFTFDKPYTFFFQRNNRQDSDFVIFHANGSVSEVSNRFDSGSYTFPDTLVYTLNTSFDNGIFWNNIPNVQLFTLYPLPYESLVPGKRFLLHDYLLNEVIFLYKGTVSGGRPYISSAQTVEDSVFAITGYVK